jgi:hypothetical protein
VDFSRSARPIPSATASTAFRENAPSGCDGEGTKMKVMSVFATALPMSLVADSRDALARIIASSPGSLTGDRPWLNASTAAGFKSTPTT